MRNIELAKEKNLIINEDTSIYDELVYKYKYVLEYYINSIINLSKYEKEIDSSNLYIGKNIKYKKLNNYLNLDYLFLINNLFVEKLSMEDINLLKNSFNKDNITDNLINLIKRTYKDIIYDNYIKGSYNTKIYKVCYGYFVPMNFVDNNSIVFRLYYGKNLKEINEKEAFIKIHKEQLDFLNNIINRIIEEFKQNDIKCEILLEKDIY